MPASLGLPPSTRLISFDLLFIQLARSTRSLSLQESAQSVALETMHPIFHGTGRVSQYLCDLWASHTLRYEQRRVDDDRSATLRTDESPVASSTRNGHPISGVAFSIDRTAS